MVGCGDDNILDGFIIVCLCEEKESLGRIGWRILIDVKFRINIDLDSSCIAVLLLIVMICTGPMVLRLNHRLLSWLFPN